MTTVFKEALTYFIAINKFTGLLHICYTIENGLLKEDTNKKLNFFIEVIRIILLLICSFHVFWNTQIYYLKLYHVINFWITFITARITEKWIIRYDIFFLYIYNEFVL